MNKKTKWKYGDIPSKVARKTWVEVEESSPVCSEMTKTSIQKDGVPWILNGTA
jgi:hypothetical protein